VGFESVSWTLLSDALELLVNVGGAVMLFAMLRIAVQPPDEDHAYGRSKAEYLAGGFDGLLVITAAGGMRSRLYA
jgi:divalent metal cation (Fe/Co/Zn/Cd) transporter